jgi:pyruvate-ferredoxin/flavodoxin oxidoreductase
MGEVRYLSVKKAYPNEAEELFAESEKMAKKRYQSYIRQTKMDWSEE